jgi:hypothetical protein
VKRRLLNFLSVLSLLLSVAAALLWVRSYYVGESCDWRGSTAGVGASASLGQLSVKAVGANASLGQLPVKASWRDPTRARPTVGLRYHADRPPWRLAVPVGSSTQTLGAGTGTYVSREWGWAGFGVRYNHGRDGAAVFLLFPHWSVVLAGLILPCARLAVHARRRRLKRLATTGHCATCGYDLRATPGRCPECGTMKA